MVKTEGRERGEKERDVKERKVEEEVKDWEEWDRCIGKGRERRR